MSCGLPGDPAEWRVADDLGGKVLVGPAKFDQPTRDRLLGRRITQLGHPPLERADRVGLFPAGVATSDVVQHPVALDPGQFAVDLPRKASVLGDS